jgi:glycerophosphoryl diester phosphodiesterase
MKIFFIVLGSLAIFLALCFCIFLILIKPSAKKRDVMARYKGVKFAHRGLHDKERAENSISAFAAAVEAGYGIELDVRLSKDGELVVFHDDTVDRMTEARGRVDSFTAKELAELRLGGTNDGVPTFREVLDVVDGKIPLLVEIKEDLGKYGVTNKAAEMLKEYKGEYIVESFNPLSVWRFKSLMPEVATGLLCANYLKNPKTRSIKTFVVQNMLLNVRCKPDFIAYSHKDWKDAGLAMIRTFYPKTPLVCWTLRSPEEEAAAKEHGFTSFIFENYKSEL